MPSRVIMTLKQTGEEKIGYYYSSLFQGALMEMLNPDYVAYLHESQLHPYSQCLQFQNGKIIWTVNALDEEADSQIIKTLLSNQLTNIRIKAHQQEFTIEDKKMESVSYNALIRTYFLGQGGRFLNLEFKTPTTFKSGERYQLFPSSRLIFQSLMMKFDQASTENSIYSDEILREIEEKTEIVGYRLRSTRFHMEGIKIPSFLGEATVRINGTAQLANVCRMLAAFGEYSGVGIKTGEGMGALGVIDPAPGR